MKEVQLSDGCDIRKWSVTWGNAYFAVLHASFLDDGVTPPAFAKADEDYLYLECEKLFQRRRSKPWARTMVTGLSWLVPEATQERGQL